MCQPVAAGTWRRSSNDPYYADRVILANRGESYSNGVDPAFYHFTPTPINFSSQRAPPRRQPMLTSLHADSQPVKSKSEDLRRGDISSWRLKWVVFLLVLVTMVQAVMLGRQLDSARAFVSRDCDCGSEFAVSVGIFVALLLALWALLSQLLQWSDNVILQPSDAEEERGDEPIMLSTR